MNNQLQEHDYENNISVDFEDDYEKPRKASGDFSAPAFSTVRKIILGASASVIAAAVVVNILMSLSTDGEATFPTLKIEAELGETPDLPVLEQPSAVQAEPVWTEHYCTRTRTIFSTARNQHFIGWIQLGETRVNEPVVQKTAEQYAASGVTGWYYLNRTFDGRAGSDLGTIFVDRNTPILDSRRPDNTVLYGHNITNLPTRKFAYLINYYTKFEETYRDFPTVQFTTIYSDVDDIRNTYLIFAGNYVNTKNDDGWVFDYFRRLRFDDSGRWGDGRDEFYDFIGNVMDRTTFLTGIDVRYGDEILTFSTCHRPLDSRGTRVDSRYALYARRVRPGEDVEAIVAQSQAIAVANPSTLYFDEFYKRMGGQWDGRGWDTQLVPGFEQWLTENPDWCSTEPRRRQNTDGSYRPN
jgi:hypothetical protein